MNSYSPANMLLAPSAPTETAVNCLLAVAVSSGHPWFRPFDAGTSRSAPSRLPLSLRRPVQPRINSANIRVSSRSSDLRRDQTKLDTTALLRRHSRNSNSRIAFAVTPRPRLLHASRAQKHRRNAAHYQEGEVSAAGPLLLLLQHPCPALLCRSRDYSTLGVRRLDAYLACVSLRLNGRRSARRYGDGGSTPFCLPEFRFLMVKGASQGMLALRGRLPGES